MVIYGVRSEEENNVIHVPLATQGGEDKEPSPEAPEEEPADNVEPTTEEKAPAAPKATPKKPWWRGRDGSFFGMGKVGDFILDALDDDVQ